MKGLSGSIVITAGRATRVAGATMRSSESIGLMAIGGLAALLGFAFWIRSLNEP
jgi:hypothetical protein